MKQLDFAQSTFPHSTHEERRAFRKAALLLATVRQYTEKKITWRISWR